MFTEYHRHLNYAGNTKKITSLAMKYQNVAFKEYILYLYEVNGENVSNLRTGVRIRVNPFNRSTCLVIWSQTRENTFQDTTPLLVFLTQSLKENQWSPVGFELQTWGQQRFHHELRMNKQYIIPLYAYINMILIYKYMLSR